MVETLYEMQFGVLMLISLALLVLKLFAFVSSLLWPAQAYDAANKLTKPAWTIILGLGVAVHLTIGAGVTSLLNLVFTVAALVYVLDVRPALASLRRR